MKEIIGFPGYFITPEGKVYSNKKGYLVELKPFKGNSRGKPTYLMIGIIDEYGNRKKKLIHRLVAEAYIDNPNNYPEVNHKDNDIYNNNADNLEWITRRGNLEQSYITLSPNRNFRYVFLFRNNEMIGAFKGIVLAARHASNNYGVSFYSLCRYLKCGEFEIRKMNNK